MQGYQDSTAYDFERFTEKKPNIVRLPQNQPQRRPQSRARIRMQERARRRRLAAKVLVCAAAVLMLVGFRIFGAIQQSEITAEITATQTSIDRLKSESTRLEMELASSISYTNLEKAAADMGMQKQQSAQTVCVVLNDEDEAEITKDDQDMSLWARLMAWF